MAIGTGTAIAIGAGAGLIGAGMSANAAKSAAQMQADAANRSMEQERAMYEQSRADLAPYRETGYTALKDIERMKPFLLGRFGQPYQAGQTRSLTAPQYAAPLTGPVTGMASPGGPGGVGTTTYLDSAKNRTQNPNPYGFIGSEGPSTQATVPYYNTKTGEQWTAPTGGYTPPSADWVQGTRPIDFAPPRAPADGTQMMPISGPGSPFEEYLDPSMAFRMKLGTQATERLANIGGGAISGNTMRALTDYGQNLASTEYGNAFNRFQTERGNIYNTLANIAGMGQGAVNTGVRAGETYSAGQTGLITGGAAAQAAGNVGAANAYSGALGNVGNMAFLSSIMKPQGVTPPLGGQQSGQIYNPVAIA